MIRKIAATPYDDRESLGWIARNLFGLSGKNAGVVKQLKSPYVFNEQVERRYRVAVIGDIMPMHGSRLVLDARLKEFIGGSDCLIGNFEGTITEKKSAIWPIAFDQRHGPAITEDLAKIFPPDKTYLSVSNNHAGDFGEIEFFKSIGILKSAGFNVFGWSGAPFVDVNDGLRVVAGTMWSNRDFSRCLRIDRAKDHIRRAAFNLVYPHMGYELELYPRPEIAALAKDMADSFDAVIANHPHCPQPVTTHYVNGCNRIIAYSLGDFCCSLKLKTMQYGLMITMDMAQTAAGDWVTGMAKWQHTECVPSPDDNFRVRALAGNVDFF